MSSRVFREIYLHINGRAKKIHPLLTAKLEPLVHDSVRQRCRKTKGVSAVARIAFSTAATSAFAISRRVAADGLRPGMK